MSDRCLASLLLMLLVVGCATREVIEPISYDIRGEVVDQVYLSPGRDFSVRLPRLWRPGAWVRDQVRPDGTLLVTFWDDLCREFAVARSTAPETADLESWVRRQVDRELAATGARVERLETVSTAAGPAVFVRYRLPGGSPCSLLRNDDGRETEVTPDADVVMYVLVQEGMLYRLAYFVGLSQGLDAAGPLPRVPAEQLLRQLLEGFQVSGVDRHAASS